MRLTERDRAALLLLSRVRVMSAEPDMARLLALWSRPPADGLGPRTVRGILHRWQTAGLVDRNRISVAGASVVSITEAGLALSALTGQGAPVGIGSLGQLRHDLTVAAVAAAYVRHGLLWSAPWERPGSSAHIPDGLVTRDEEQWGAVEVELTRKSAGRWGRIVHAHLSAYDWVTYWCPPEVASSLSSWAKRELTTDEMLRFRVTNLKGLLR